MPAENFANILFYKDYCYIVKSISVYDLLPVVNLSVSISLDRFWSSTNLPNASFSMIVGETRGHIEQNHIVLPLSEEQKQQFLAHIFQASEIG